MDWSGLDATVKRRRIPELVQKLITVYGPTKKSLEDWRDDFTKTKILKSKDLLRETLDEPKKAKDTNTTE